VPALRWGPQAFVAQRGWPRLRELLRADGEELADAENLAGGTELAGGVAAAGGTELTGGMAPRGGLELVGGGGRADGVVGVVSTEGTW
jgi:pilus assembly protein CpaF